MEQPYVFVYEAKCDSCKVVLGVAAFPTAYPDYPAGPSGLLCGGCSGVGPYVPSTVDPELSVDSEEE